MSAAEMFREEGYRIDEQYNCASCPAYLKPNVCEIYFNGETHMVEIDSMDEDTHISVLLLKAINQQVKELGW